MKKCGHLIALKRLDWVRFSQDEVFHILAINVETFCNLCCHSMVKLITKFDKNKNLKDQIMNPSELKWTVNIQIYDKNLFCNNFHGNSRRMRKNRIKTIINA